MTTVLLRGGRVLDPVDGSVVARDLGVVGGRIAPPGAASGGRVVDLGGAIVAPGFVDLHAALVHPGRDGGAAAAGGFTTVVASPERPAVLDRPDTVRALLDRAASAPCRVLAAGALTPGLKGDDLAELGLLARAGARWFGHGAVLLGSARVLRHALEYAARLGLPVCLRAGEPELEDGGVVREGPRSVGLGLPGVPPESEESGIHRLAALARLTGARLHVSHVWSAAGVEALRRVRGTGVSLTASTTVHHLGLDPDAVGRSPYDGDLRFVPPLGDAADRAALREALRDGTLDAVATDHLPWPRHAKDRPFAAARPGAVALDLALPLVLSALDRDLLTAVRALSVGPRRALGLPPARLAVGEVADLVVVDPDGATHVDRPRGAHANTPLAGAVLPGAVHATWVGGRPTSEVGSPGDTG
jgi:dihydroorotase